MKNWFAVASLGVAASLAVSAVADDDHGGRHQGKRVFRAELVSYNEVPSVSSPARGQFYAVLNKEENQLTYWLSFSDLTADVSQSHIHFGQHHTNGGIVVWLCEGTLHGADGKHAGLRHASYAKHADGRHRSHHFGRDHRPGAGTEPRHRADRVRGAHRGDARRRCLRERAFGAGNVPPAPNVGFPGGEIRGQIN